MRHLSDGVGAGLGCGDEEGKGGGAADALLPQRDGHGDYGTATDGDGYAERGRGGDALQACRAHQPLNAAGRNKDMKEPRDEKPEEEQRGQQKEHLPRAGQDRVEGAQKLMHKPRILNGHGDKSDRIKPGFAIPQE